MSIGNTKTDGNKGNNYPFQSVAVQLLKNILAAISSSGGGLPTNSMISQVYFEESDNATVITKFQAWKAFNPTRKIVARTPLVSNTGAVSGLLIEYI